MGKHNVSVFESLGFFVVVRKVFYNCIDCIYDCKQIVCGNFDKVDKAKRCRLAVNDGRLEKRCWLTESFDSVFRNAYYSTVYFIVRTLCFGTLERCESSAVMKLNIDGKAQLESSGAFSPEYIMLWLKIFISAPYV